MIIQLVGGKIKIVPMPVPEQIEHMYIQYAYEAGTNHLLPHLTISEVPSPESKRKLYKIEQLGDKVFVNMHDGFSTHTVHIKVELLDGSGFKIRSYESNVPYLRYCIVGVKPVRPDVAAYVHYLEQRVQELEEKGEVI